MDLGPFLYVERAWKHRRPRLRTHKKLQSRTKKTRSRIDWMKQEKTMDAVVLRALELALTPQPPTIPSPSKLTPLPVSAPTARTSVLLKRLVLILAPALFLSELNYASQALGCASYTIGFLLNSLIALISFSGVLIVWGMHVNGESGP